MADYWMKLYIEILDDPKMATLPDRVWRRVIELFLVAKRLGKEGHIPDTRQIAWMLRMNPDELESDMAQIAQTGIVVREVNGWFIPKFAQRQAAVPDKDRKAQQRDREKSQQYYGNVTTQSRNVTQSTETEDRVQNTEAETEAEGPGPALFDLCRAAIERVGIMPTPEDQTSLTQAIKDGMILEDLQEGIAWKIGNSSGKAIKYASAFWGPAETAKRKRLQKTNGQPAPAIVNGKKQDADMSWLGD